MMNWDPLITWWELRSHHFWWHDEEIGGPWWCNGKFRVLCPLMTQWGKIGGPWLRNGQFRALCPLMTQWGNCKPLIKQWGNCGAKWPDEENGKLDPWWRNGTLIWGAFWWCNGQIRDPSDDEIGAPWWPDGEIWGPRPLILFKRFNTAPLHSFKLMGSKF